MEKDSIDKNFIWLAVLVFSMILLLLLWVKALDVFGEIDNFNVVTSSIPGYTDKEIEKEILLGNKDEIESKRVYKFKNLKISKQNYYINKNKKLLGEFLELDIRRGYVKNDFFIHVKDEKTIDMLLNLKHNEFLELSYASKKTNHYGKMDIFYEIIGKRKLVSDNVYKVFYTTLLPLVTLFLIVLMFVSIAQIRV